MAVGDGTIPKVHDGALRTSSITGFIGVPVLFTVVTEVCITSGPLTLDLRTSRTFSGYHCIPINDKMICYSRRLSTNVKSHLDLMQQLKQLLGSWLFGTGFTTFQI